MEFRKVHYPSRGQMTRGITKMGADGWVVWAITALASKTYSVRYGRALVTPAENEDAATGTLVSSGTSTSARTTGGYPALAPSA